MIDYSSLIYLQSRAACLLGRMLCSRNGHRYPTTEAGHERILVVKTDEIGDFVLSTVFLRELRLTYPKAEIVLVVSPVAYNLAELCPYVDEILVYRQGVTRLLRPFVLPWRAFKLGHSVLQPREFDLAVMPRWDMDGYYAAYIGYFSCAGRRVGFTEEANPRKKMVNRGFDLLLTEAVFRESPRHEVERHLDLIRHLGGTPSSNATELWIDDDDEAHADRLLSGISAGPRVALCPGAGTAWRRWPTERFIELAKGQAESCDASFVVIGGRGDMPLGNAIRKSLGGAAVDVTGRTTLRQTAALLKKCDLYVGNDTGSMHLAAAAGIPVVEISCFPMDGPVWHWNSPRRFAPWGVPHRILQPKGNAPRTADLFQSIETITVEQVRHAVAELLGRRNAAGDFFPRTGERLIPAAPAAAKGYAQI